MDSAEFARSADRERFEGESESEGGIAGDEKQAFGSERPRTADPAGLGLPPGPGQGHDIADGLAQSATDNAGESMAIFIIVEIALAGIDVGGELLFLFDGAPDIFIRRLHPCAVDLEAIREFGEELTGLIGFRFSAIDRVGEQIGICPKRFAIGAPEATVGPAWERLSGIPFPLAEMEQASRRKAFLQATDQLPGQLLFVVADGSRGPFGSLHIVDGDEGRFPSHGEADIIVMELFIDFDAESIDLVPLMIGVGERDAGILVDPFDGHRDIEFRFAFVEGA